MSHFSNLVIERCESDARETQHGVPNCESEAPGFQHGAPVCESGAQGCQHEVPRCASGARGTQHGEHRSPTWKPPSTKEQPGVRKCNPSDQATKTTLTKCGCSNSFGRKINTLFRPPCTADSLAGWLPSLYQGLVFDLEFNVEMLRGKN